jgi:hypothetical protein
MDIRVVFVHLGHQNPPHLWQNLRRHLREFPGIPATLVLSDDKHAKQVPEGVEVLFHDAQRDSTQFEGYALNPSFRGGFWRLTIERLVALDTAHIAHPKAKLIHIESDVLLLPNFPWTALAKEERMMWGGATADLDIAAILYSPSLLHTQHLTEFIRQRIMNDTEITDMKVLKEYFSAYQGQKVRRLPFTFLDESFEGGFFDVMSIGQWLTGLDPTNAVGWRKYHVPMPHHLVDPSLLTYEFYGDSLIASQESLSKDLFSLHVHSKDISLFGTDWRKRLKELVELSADKPAPLSSFSTIGFLGWVKEFLREIFSKKFAVAVFKKLLRLPRN